MERLPEQRSQLQQKVWKASPALGPEPDQTVQAGPADTVRTKGHPTALWQGQLAG